MNEIHGWLFDVFCEEQVPVKFLDKVCGESELCHKNKLLHELNLGNKRIIVCTSVWSNGINFVGIDFVVNAGPEDNSNLSKLHQQSGRACR